MDKEAELYIIFDMLADLVRSGPLQWKIKRFRTEDVKDHIFDLILMTKMIKPYIPEFINTNKMIDYAIVHDLEEVITGDITTFEGITKFEKDRVNTIAMNYLINNYGDIINLKKYMTDYENQSDIEAKVLHMLDKVNSSIAFLKYDNENQVDMDNPEIVKCLRTNKDVLKYREEGLSLGEIFYRWHLKSVVITDEELQKYNITRTEAEKITNAIKSLMRSIHDKIKYVDKIEKDFPMAATLYKKMNV